MTEETIFTTALDRKTPAERSAFLDEACGGDAALRQRVVALIEAHEQAADFLEKPALEQMAASSSPPNSPTEPLQAIKPAVEGISATPSEELIGETQAEPPHDDEDGLSLHFLAPSERPDALGRIDHYHVLAVVGHGGMGVVLKAFDEKLQRVVAIKVMRPQLAGTGSARKRFIREAKAAAAVRDEHVIDIHAVEEANGLPYLVMEYVGGISLQERIDQSGPLEVKEILRIGMQTATGLARAHAQGLIHRDIKPANILLENGVQRVKLTDFGLARAVDDASLTQSGVIAGTPQYMAPEQACGEAVDHRADLFSLGSVLYAMCTGHPPFRASSTMAVLKRVCDDTPRPIREINPDIPDWLAAIIDKLHAKEPAQRFQSAKEVAELLGQHLAHLQQPARMPLPPPVPRADAGAATATGTHSLLGPVLMMLTPLLLLPVCGAASWLFGFGWLLFDLCVVVSGYVFLTGLILLVFRAAAGRGQEKAAPMAPPSKRSSVWVWGLLAVGVLGLACCLLSVPAVLMFGWLVGRPSAQPPISAEVEVDTPPEQNMLAKQPAGLPAPARRSAPFVVLGHRGQKEHAVHSLAAAVARAQSGDTIEIRGNGPFASEPVLLANKALTIRAGEGFGPVLNLKPKEGKLEDPLLETYAPLVLEGLALQRLEPWQGAEGHPERNSLVLLWKGSLRAANCRFLLKTRGVGIWASESSVCDLRNCEFGGPDLHAAVDWTSPPGGLLSLENSLLLAGPHGLVIHQKWAAPRSCSIRLAHNTVSANIPLDYWLWAPVQKALDPARDKASPSLRIESEANLFDTPGHVLDFKQVDQPQPLAAKEAETVLPRLVFWRERRNIYPARPGQFLLLSSTNSGEVLRTPVSPPRVATVADWGHYWGVEDADAGCGVVKYQGGDVRVRAKNKPEQIVPSDFRLGTGSAGKGAGEDGRDLGADVDLVGPGAAYERWKKTPEYQRWRKDTQQAENGKP